MSYLSLEEAAAKLGISTERLVELRSEGQIRGFRDGSSWKFPDNEIDRLADDLADQADDAGRSGLVDDGGESDDDLEIDSVFDTDEGALMEIDSAELRLDDPALMQESNDSIDIAIDPKEGSTGPVAKAEIEKEADKISISDVDISDDSSASEDEEFSFAGELAEEDSDDLVLGAESEDSLDLDMLADDLGIESGGGSSLEKMKDAPAPESDVVLGKSGADVLSELDLLGAEQTSGGSGGGSGLISGDSENLLTSSGLGSGLGSSVIGEIDDALDDDDDLVIADDDADLMLDSVSDISVAGDSGINLMSPSDSGLSLESEPLDLAGSSLSALDLGAELTDGSGISGGSSSKSSGGSGTDFAASDEEFQLSPSGVGLDADLESSSQVIEVEDSEIVSDAVDLQDDFGDDAGFADAGFSEGAFDDAQPLDADAFEEAPAGAVGLDADPMGDGISMDEVSDSPAVGASAGSIGYEIPFSLMQCLSLMFIILVLSLGGMLMTDLVRNMWAYNETSAPVSSLTDSLIGLMGWGS
ncbi:helix-turn-helix domain-containing protein [Stieleria sp. TO1_6]|uniref:helix-turn-helix domain-containing protein n=1 Tax=Stieleria tagensis TaxID=2956795 RepID=UPI00209A9694|nr:helix-turn-helix domain-containing protein [Stieleria tagensis]MCO8120181.1 helix-turn-helix domain-containing protein [Stieleria tagensis]